MLEIQLNTFVLHGTAISATKINISHKVQNIINKFNTVIFSRPRDHGI